MEREVFDLSLLRERIKSKGMRLDQLAERIGIGKWALFQKLHGRYDFKSTEIVRLAEALGIPNREIATYFFRR